MPDSLICIPAERAKLVARNSTTGLCGRCFTSVMLAPSSRRWLAQRPGALLVCLDCIDWDDMQDSKPCAPLYVIAEELASAVYNLYRSRN